MILLQRSNTGLKSSVLLHALCRYMLTVHTSDVKGAGTDANVYTRIMGTDSTGAPCSTSLMKLESSKENFERGRYATNSTWKSTM